MSNWIHDYVRILARDPLPEDAENMAAALVREARNGNLEAERALCVIRLNRISKGMEPIKAVENWLEYGLALRSIGHENWNVCLRPDITQHAKKITPENKLKETRRWFDDKEIVEAVERAYADGFSKATYTPKVTAYEIACNTLKKYNGEHMPSGAAITPEAIRSRYQRAKRKR